MPHHFLQIEQVPKITPATLHEICLRKLYELRLFRNLNSDKIADEQLVLPKYLQETFYRGPSAICDSPKCKRPMFEYTIMTACRREEDANYLISAYFCSSSCHKLWSNAFKMKSLRWKRSY